MTKGKRIPQDLRQGTFGECNWVAEPRDSTLTTLWERRSMRFSLYDWAAIPREVGLAPGHTLLKAGAHL